MNDELQKQLIHDLVLESLEGLDCFDSELMALEGESADPAERLRNAFRVMHTVKGSSGCLGFEAIEKVAHAGENLLSLLRDGLLPVNQELVSGLLRCSDALREMIRSIEDGVAPELSRHLDLLALLEALQVPPENTVPVAMKKKRWGIFAEEQAEAKAAAPAAASSANAGWGLFDEAPAEPNGPEFNTPPVQPVQAKPQLAQENTPRAVSNASSVNTAMSTSSTEPRVSDSAIRVEVAQIDRLMNLVGELVLARNQIVQLAGERADGAWNGPVQRVNLITTELQESVMKTRMQAVQTVWSKFPRLVRDLSVELDKRVSLTMEGQDTELDRTVIEAIKDPLTHIVRNAIDHGIELPAQRLEAGKSESGRLHLKAFHEGGQVVLEIADDGAGIDPARLLRKALDRGIISSEEAGRMSEREVLNLIFVAGFSTAEKISNVSGRGVGMDVVRSNVERIGGTVEVSSTIGEGTTMQIRIPLTLAIIPALLVECAGGRYAIPQASLVELVRLDSSVIGRRLEWVDQSPVFRLRGKLLALLDLGRTLDLRPEAAGEDSFLVVVEAGGRKFGIMVDQVDDTEEIVVKPLNRVLKAIGAYAGATILGDGRVALILDVAGLARRAGMHSQRLLNAGANRKILIDSAAPSATRRMQLLMARVASNRLAFPLEGVRRIEEVPLAKVERTGQREVLQYRGRIMNLLRLRQILGFPALDYSDPYRSSSGEAFGHHSEDSTGHLMPESICVVVCQMHHGETGLIIDSVEDIVEESVGWNEQEDLASSSILSASLVVGGRVADLVDLQRIEALAGMGSGMGRRA
jgi:two-component system, chemotaxis family, sensor kinase CheA